MRPGENGGVILDNQDEIGLALDTLGASRVDVGLGATSAQGHDQISALSETVAGAARAGAETLVLDGPETITLRDACRVAGVHGSYALGMVVCYQILRGVSAPAAIGAMKASGHTELSIAAHIARVSPAATILSVMLDAHSGQSPID